MSLEDKLNRIDALNEQFKAAQPLPTERFDELWKKFRLEWDYNSNHMEGNTLTYGETVLLLIFGKTTGDHDAREYKEMEAHDTAIKMIQEWAEDKNRDLTEADIRTLNKIILVKPFWKEARTNDGQPTRRLIKIGDYKEFTNSVQLKTGEMFHYAPPEETPRLMGELMEWYKKSKTLHPLILASELHYKFIRIHPFDDGNGRVARLLVNYVLMKNDYPPLIVKSKDKENYLTALQKADSGDLDAFNEYMADQLIWSLEIANKAAKGESIEELDDLDKEIELLKREVSNIEEEDAQWVFDKEKFLKIYDSWLGELIKKLIVQIQKFNDLFVNPQHLISIYTNVHEGVGGEIINVVFYNESESEIVNGLKEKITAALIISSNTIVKIHVSYGTFKKSAQKKPFGCRYEMEIVFDYLNYQIYLPEFREDMMQLKITNGLKEYLKDHENIQEVHFNVDGKHFFVTDDDLLKALQIPNITISRDDILNDKIIMGGLIRVFEPRLLHKPVSNLEIEEISKDFSKTILNHIKHCTKSLGLH